MVEKFVKYKINEYSSGITLFFFPILLLNLNSTWIFTPVTNFMPDPWFYFAYFRYFYTYAPEFPSNIHYFVERLTWNVPGYYIYHIFPPLLANYILHLSVYYVAIFSLFGILKHLFNQRTALLGALFMGSYPWFLRAAGWDYVDGTGIAHTLLLVYVLTIAPQSKHRNSLFIFAGIVNASLIMTNLFWISFTPSWMIYFAALNRKSNFFNLKQIAFALIQFVGGNIIVIGSAAIFSKIVLGRYSYFYARSLDFMEMLSQNTESINNVKEVLRIYGHMDPYWLVIPIVLAVITIAELSLKSHRINVDAFQAVIALFTLSFGWLTFWHIFRIPYLLVFLYSSFLIPSIFILFGTLLSSKLDALTESRFNTILVTGLIVLILPFILVVLYPSVTTLQGSTILIFISCCILLFGFLASKRAQGLTFILVSFSALSFLGGGYAYVYAPHRLKARDNFNAIISASQVIDSYFPEREYDDFKLWYRSDQNYDTFFSLSSIYLYPWGSTLGSPYSGRPPMEVMTLNRYNKFIEGDQVVILSSSPNANQVMEEANRGMSERDASLTLDFIAEIHEGSTRFFIYFTTTKFP